MKGTPKGRKRLVNLVLVLAMLTTMFQGYPVFAAETPTVESTITSPSEHTTIPDAKEPAAIEQPSDGQVTPPARGTLPILAATLRGGSGFSTLGISDVVDVKYTKTNGQPFADTTQWDYLTDYNYITNLIITPGQATPGRTVEITAPAHMHFIAPSATPEGVISITLSPDGTKATVTLTATTEHSAISIGFLTTYETTDATGNREDTALAIGNDIKTAVLASQPRPVSTTKVIYTEGGTSENLDVSILYYYYADTNIFESFRQWAAGDKNLGVLHNKKDNGIIDRYGKFGAYSTHAFAEDDWFYLNNTQSHEPYWGLSVKVYIPTGLKTTRTDVTVYHDAGGDYLLFANINEGSAANEIAALNRMISPTKDEVDGYKAQGPDFGDYLHGSCVFGTGMGFAFADGETFVPNKEYPFDIQVKYTTAAGPQTQDFTYKMICENIKLTDRFSLKQYTKEETNGYMDTYFDFPQGVDIADTGIYTKKISILEQGLGGEFVNNDHKGGTLTIEPGEGYEIYKVNFSFDADVVYYMEGDPSPHTANKVWPDFTYELTDAQTSGRVTKIVMTLINGLRDVNESNPRSGEIKFSMRTLDNLTSNTSDPNTYESNIKITLRGAGANGCAAYENQTYPGYSGTPPAFSPDIVDGSHTKKFSVYLRKPTDKLIASAYGNNINTYMEKNRADRYPFLSAKTDNRSVADWPIAQVAFGRSDITDESDSFGSWMNYTYNNFRMDFTGSRVLETVGKMYVSSHFVYTGAKLVYSTNLTPNKEIVLGNQNNINVLFDLADGEYITALAFTADTFRPTILQHSLVKGGDADAWVDYWGGKNGTMGSAQFEFYPRTERAFRSDGTPIANFDTGSYPIGATFTADGFGAARSATAPAMGPSNTLPANTEARYSRYVNDTFNVIDITSNFSTDGATTASQGGTFTARVTNNWKTEHTNQYFPPNGKQVWLKVNPGFVYVGNDPNIRPVIKDGATWLIIGEASSIDDDSAIPYFDIPMMVLPTTSVGTTSVFDETRTCFTGSMDLESQKETAPYHVATSIWGPYTNDPSDINDNGITLGEYVSTWYNRVNFTVTLANKTGAYMYPGASGQFFTSAADYTAVFDANSIDTLTGYLALGSAPQQLTNFEATVQLPRKGDTFTYTTGAGQTKTVTSDFDLLLTEPITPTFGAVSVQVTYCVDGAWKTASEVTAANEWSQVTDLKAFIPTFAPDVTVSALLSLIIPASDKADIARGDMAYMRAHYSFEGAGGADTYSNVIAYKATWENSFNGQVFKDLDNDNLYTEANDAPYAGITVELYNASAFGQPVGDRVTFTTTASDGTYNFTDLDNGTYMIKVIKPDNIAYSFCTQGVASNASHVTSDGLSTTAQFNIANTSATMNAGIKVTPKLRVEFRVDTASGSLVASSTVDKQIGDFGTITPGSTSGYDVPQNYKIKTGTPTSLDYVAFTWDEPNQTLIFVVESLGHNVTFNKNGGDTEASPATKTVMPPATTIDVLPAPPTRANYVFTGWNTEANGSGTPFTASTPVTGDITVYAQWKYQEFTITYDLQNGALAQGVSNPTTYTVNSPTITLNNPSKTGYTFTGWTGSNGATPQTTVTIPTGSSGNKNYTATYSANSYIVTYAKNTIDRDGDAIVNTVSGTTADSTHVYDVAKNLTANGYACAGYTFTGWNTAADGSGTAYSDQASVTNLTATNGATVTLYAQWTKAGPYTITYDLQNGALAQGVSNPATYTVNTPTITLNNPSKTGYAFTGWTGSNGSFPQTTVTIPLGSTGNKAYTANWAANSYTVVYDKNTVDVSQNTLKNTPSGTTTSSTHVYDVAKNLTANGYTCAGYTFAGWNSQADGLGTPYANAQSVINLASANGATVTLYAQWVMESDYAITYDLQNGALAQGATNPTSYNVATPTFTLNNPSKTGHTFTGWTGTGITSVDASTTVTIPQGSTGNRSYTATWRAHTYTVTYDQNTIDRAGDTLVNEVQGTTADSTHTYDVAKNLTANGYTCAGYTFAGWNSQADGLGTPYANAQSVINLTATDEGTVTLYAQWVMESDYTITYDLQNGALAQGATNPTSYNVATPTFTLNNPTKTGYTFVGWFGTDITSSEASITVTIPHGSTGDRSYEATWTPNRYTINYDPNTINIDNTPHAVAPEGIMTPSVHAYDVAQDLNENTFTLEGHYFLGWNTEPDGTGTPYADEEEVLNLLNEDGSQLTLYAQWAPIGSITAEDFTYDIHAVDIDDDLAKECAQTQVFGYLVDGTPESLENATVDQDELALINAAKNDWSIPSALPLDTFSVASSESMFTVLSTRLETKRYPLTFTTEDEVDSVTIVVTLNNQYEVNDETPPTNTTPARSVKTGDTANLAVGITALIASGFALLVSRKKNGKIDPLM